MKKFVMLILIISFCAGCGTLAKESELWRHDTHFQSWEPMKFSLWGYKKADPETANESKVQEWWGISIKESVKK